MTNDNDAVNAVVPPSSTKGEDAYAGVSVAFEGVCIGAFANVATAADIALSRCRRDAATALPPLRCALPPRFALPPPPLTLPLPPCRRQAASDVELSCCRHRRSLRAAATVLPLSRCSPTSRFALPPPPLTLLGGLAQQWVAPLCCLPCCEQGAHRCPG